MQRYQDGSAPSRSPNQNRERERSPAGYAARRRDPYEEDPRYRDSRYDRMPTYEEQEAMRRQERRSMGPHSPIDERPRTPPSFPHRSSAFHWEQGGSGGSGPISAPASAPRLPPAGSAAYGREGSGQAGDRGGPHERLPSWGPHSGSGSSFAPTLPNPGSRAFGGMGTRNSPPLPPFRMHDVGREMDREREQRERERERERDRDFHLREREREQRDRERSRDRDFRHDERWAPELKGGFARRHPSDSPPSAGGAQSTTPRGDPMSMSSLLGPSGPSERGPSSRYFDRSDGIEKRRRMEPSESVPPPPPSHQLASQHPDEQRRAVSQRPGDGTTPPGHSSGSPSNNSAAANAEASAVAANLSRRKWSGPIAEEAAQQAAAWRAQEMGRLPGGRSFTNQPSAHEAARAAAFGNSPLMGSMTSLPPIGSGPFPRSGAGSRQNSPNPRDGPGSGHKRKRSENPAAGGERRPPPQELHYGGPGGGAGGGYGGSPAYATQPLPYPEREPHPYDARDRHGNGPPHPPMARSPYGGGGNASLPPPPGASGAPPQGPPSSTAGHPRYHAYDAMGRPIEVDVDEVRASNAHPPPPPPPPGAHSMPMGGPTGPVSSKGRQGPQVPSSGAYVPGPLPASKPPPPVKSRSGDGATLPLAPGATQRVVSGPGPTKGSVPPPPPGAAGPVAPVPPQKVPRAESVKASAGPGGKVRHQTPSKGGRPGSGHGPPPPAMAQQGYFPPSQPQPQQGPPPPPPQQQLQQQSQQGPAYGHPPVSSSAPILGPAPGLVPPVPGVEQDLRHGPLQLPAKEFDVPPRVDSDAVWEYIDRVEMTRAEKEKQGWREKEDDSEEERDPVAAAEAARVGLEEQEGKDFLVGWKHGSLAEVLTGSTRKPEAAKDVEGQNAEAAAEDAARSLALASAAAGWQMTARRLGSWRYDALVDPLLPGELLLANVGAMLEVRIPGAWLGPGPTSVNDGCGGAEESKGGATPSRWGLGWRGRERAKQRSVERSARSKATLNGPKPTSAASLQEQSPIPVSLQGLSSFESNDAAARAFWTRKSLIKRKVWGTDVYTDDSDVVAMCLHAGWIEGPTIEGVPSWVPPGKAVWAWKDMTKALEQEDKAQNASPRPEGDVDGATRGIEDEQMDTKPDVNVNVNGNGNGASLKGKAAASASRPLEKRTCDVSVTLRIAPKLIAYKGSQRGGIKSRSWGNTHDGVSLVVESVELKEPGYAAALTTPHERLQALARLRLHAALSSTSGKSSGNRAVVAKGLASLEEAALAARVVLAETETEAGEGPEETPAGGTLAANGNGGGNGNGRAAPRDAAEKPRWFWQVEARLRQEGAALTGTGGA